MSWLFGIKSTPPAPNPSDILGVDINSAAGGSGGDGKDPAKEAAQKGIESNYRFDSSALERAAAGMYKSSLSCILLQVLKR